MRVRGWSLCTVLVGALAVPSQAQEVHVGVQASFSNPSGALQDSAGPAVGGTLFLDWSLGGGMVVRPRLDYVQYKNRTSTSQVLTSSSATTTVSDNSIKYTGYGVDYLYYPVAYKQGFHLDIGVEEMSFANSPKGTITVDAITSNTTPFSGPTLTKSKLGFSLGAGYDFTQHWLAGLRYTSTRIDSDDFSSFSLSLGYRF